MFDIVPLALNYSNLLNYKHKYKHMALKFFPDHKLPHNISDLRSLLVTAEALRNSRIVFQADWQ